MRAAAIVVALLSLLAACSTGGKEAQREPGSAAVREPLRTFSGRGISFRYPQHWSVAGFSTTVSPARLAVASYPLPADAVEGDCGGRAAVEALPRNGALVILIDYGKASSSEFAPPPVRFRLADGTRANYECFGASTMFRFQVGGRALQAQVAIGDDAAASLSRKALAVLDSVVVERDDPGSSLDDRPTSLTELALHPNRWVGRSVVVEGQLYKFPGNGVSSAKA